MAMHLILIWALVGLIGRADCKCSITPIAGDGRSIAYACTHSDLTDLDEVSSEAEWIELTVSRFQLIPDNAFSRFTNLRRLSFYNCRVDFVAPDAFAGLDRLEWLILHGTRIHVARTAWFRPLRNLRKLILDRCGLVHIEPDLFRALPNLETLGLRDNDLDCLSTEELSRLRNLRTVRIDGNPWLCDCRQRMDRYFQDRGIVQEVECAGNVYFCKKHQCMMQIDFPVVWSHSSTSRFDDLSRVRGTSQANGFETNVLTSLDRLPDKTTWIEISGLTIETIPRYAFFRFGNSLRSLDLSDCRIDRIEEGAFAGLHQLQRLSLVRNQFQVVGATWFRDLVNLQQLILQGNDIEEIERSALSHVGESLRYLNVRNNRLRCLATEELAALKKLERLDATGNPWLCACRSRLQSFLTRENVGYEINAGRCYENEIEITNAAVDQRQQVGTETTSLTGRVHWTSFEDTMKHSNITIVRPPVAVRPTEAPLVVSKPPVYEGSCYPEKVNHPAIYACRSITSIEDLSVIPSTAHTIRVSMSNIKKLPPNAFARFNGYLSRLEFHDCGIEKIDPRAFLGLYNLHHLSLTNNQLDSIDAGTIEGLTNLRYLDVSRNNINGIANSVFDALPYLNYLDVSDNSMNCIGVEYIARRLRHLTSLKVANNPWSCLCATKLAELLDARGILYDKRSLLVREDCFGSATVTTPQTTPHTVIVNQTEAETVKGDCVSSEDEKGLRYRCIGGNLALLKSIPSDVSAIEFHEGHLPRLTTGSLSRHANLRELVITNSGLAVIEPGAFEGIDKLQNLTIQDNPLEMLGPSWFPLSNLERLDLRGNSIKRVDSGAFKYLDRLEYLNLEGNDLKCIFSSDLNDMPSLYVVEYAGNPLKWRCRVDLEQFLEARKIRFVRVENSCEGKKLVRSLLLVNKTDGSFDCPSECSVAAVNVDRSFTVYVVSLFMLLLTWSW